MRQVLLIDLAQQALPVVAEIATRLGIESGDRDFGELGGWVCTFAQVLSSPSLPPKQRKKLEENVGTILNQVEKACAGPTPQGAEGHPILSSIANAKALKKASFSWSSRSTLIPTDLELKIKENLRFYVRRPGIRPILHIIEECSTLKEHESADITSETDSTLVEKTEDVPGYPLRVNQNLYDALKLHLHHCTCESGPHSARLRLNPGEASQDTNMVRFDMLFSVPSRHLHSLSVVEWQETKIIVPSKDPRKKRAQIVGEAATQHCSSGLPSDTSKKEIEPGQFCRTFGLEEGSLLSFEMHNHSALRRIDDDEYPLRRVKSVESQSLSNILENRRMSRKAKCILAYTLAKSVWQYYGSDWMKTPWTHENIHLLDDHDPENQRVKNQMFLCRLYLTANFGPSDTEIPEFCKGEGVMHRYPKVLALGILLVEIAKGQLLGTQNIPHLYDAKSINEHFISAWSSLNQGIHGKDDDYITYKEAVRMCLDLDLFAEAPYLSGEERPEESLKERRAILYKRIVSPLKKLLEGTGWMSELDEIRQESLSQSEVLSVQTPPPSKLASVQESREIEQEIEVFESHYQPSFLSRKPKWTPDFWLKKIDFINGIMEMRATKGGIARPTRIAILDTGCSLDAPIFSMKGQEDRIRNHWKDWVEDAPSPKDDDGHGSRIVSLLLRVAPTAEVFVARVVKDPKDLREASGAVSQAIRHAASVWDVDIVSLSFGFPTEVDSIRQAIHERGHSIIFFAAAANDGSNSAEMFPACMDSVISVRGTKATGEFIPLYNPERPSFNRGQHLYGTLGEDVPCGWPRNEPSMLMSGCSIATPIAAGIAALIIQCVASSPERFGKKYQEEIYRKRGIIEVFHEISVHQGNDRYYIAPWKLFTSEGEIRFNTLGAAIDRLLC